MKNKILAVAAVALLLVIEGLFAYKAGYTLAKNDNADLQNTTLLSNSKPSLTEFCVIADYNGTVFNPKASCLDCMMEKQR